MAAKSRFCSRKFPCSSIASHHRKHQYQFRFCTEVAPQPTLVPLWRHSQGTTQPVGVDQKHHDIDIEAHERDH
eukprot:2269753-Rhodomonas_salina.4